MAASERRRRARRARTRPPAGCRRPAPRAGRWRRCPVRCVCAFEILPAPARRKRRRERGFSSNGGGHRYHTLLAFRYHVLSIGARCRDVWRPGLAEAALAAKAGHGSELRRRAAERAAEREREVA